MLHCDVARHPEQVGLEVKDGARVGDAQHPQVDLLRKIRGVEPATGTPTEERLKCAALLGKQPFKQHVPRLSHAAYRP
jgi:hypothetical protein